MESLESFPPIDPEEASSEGLEPVNTDAKAWSQFAIDILDENKTCLLIYTF